MTAKHPRRPKFANLSWVLPTLAAGGDLSYDDLLAARQVREIKELGITHIFDARIEANDAYLWEREDVTYLNRGTDDQEGHHIPRSVFDDAVAMGRECMAAGGRMLTHCHMGVNRGPSVAAAVMLDRGIQAEEVLRLLKARRPQAGVYYFMDAYDAHVARRGAVSEARRAEVEQAWRDTFRTREAIQHVTRTIHAHHARDAHELELSIRLADEAAEHAAFLRRPDFEADGELVG